MRFIYSGRYLHFHQENGTFGGGRVEMRMEWEWKFWCVETLKVVGQSTILPEWDLDRLFVAKQGNVDIWTLR